MSDQTPWTPGPWEVGDYNEIRADRPNDSDCVLIGSYTNSPLGLDHNGSRTRPLTGEEAYANARLIAAAPEMAEALQAVLAVLSDALADEECDASTQLGGYIFGDVMSDAVFLARNALAKIGGAT